MTPHFTLRELVRSDTAEARGIDNTPTAAALVNLQRLAELLEQVRALLCVPMIISSGYRCQALNRAVGGVANSAHAIGLAADFNATRFGTPLTICQDIADSDIEFDQLIHEYGRWVHIGLRAGEPHRQVLTIDDLGTRSGLFTIRGN